MENTKERVKARGKLPHESHLFPFTFLASAQNNFPSLFTNNFPLSHVVSAQIFLVCLCFSWRRFSPRAFPLSRIFSRLLLRSVFRSTIENENDTSREEKRKIYVRENFSPQSRCRHFPFFFHLERMKSKM